MSMNQFRAAFIVLMVVALSSAILALVSAVESKTSNSSSVESYEPTSAINRVSLTNDISLIVDEQTGCQYIETKYGITPRMHSDNIQYCIPPDMEMTDLNLSLHFSDFEI